MNKKMLKKLWVEKYRPQNLTDIIFQDEAQRLFFENIVKTKQLPNLLLSGVQGTGKTTLSLALVKELGAHPADVMLVKCSDSGMENTRDVVSRFAETMPIGDFKIIRMEECDYLHHTEQAILRHIVEDTSENCRFIFTCNNVNKITGPLKSRLQTFTFRAPAKEAVEEQMINILTNENVDLESEQAVNSLEKILAATYPDIRKTIQVLQQSTVTIDGKRTLQYSSVDLSGADYKFKLLDLFDSSDFDEMRTFVCNNIDKNEFEELYQFLYQNISKIKKFKDTENEKKAIIIIADYLYKHALVAHPDINLAALFIALDNI